MRRIVSWVIILSMLVFSAVAYAQGHIYDNAVEFEHPVDGIISICEAPEKECTLEALNDWYYNYILTTDYAWYMIKYSDSNNNMGVYGTKDEVVMNIVFAQNSKGWYVGSEKFALHYIPSGEDGLIFSMGC